MGVEIPPRIPKSEGFSSELGRVLTGLAIQTKAYFIDTMTECVGVIDGDELS